MRTLLAFYIFNIKNQAMVKFSHQIYFSYMHVITVYLPLVSCPDPPISTVLDVSSAAEMGESGDETISTLRWQSFVGTFFRDFGLNDALRVLN